MDYPGKFADQIVLDKIHQINLSFLVNTLKEGQGGTAGNIAYNISLLGERVAIVGSAGKDFGDYFKFLKKHHVVTDFIHLVKDDYTARAYITTDLVDNQITGFYPGALNYNTKLSLPKQVTPSDFVIIAPDDPVAMAHYVDECIKRKIPFLFDPGMQLPRLPIDVLAKGTMCADIVIGNDYEIGLLSQKLKGKSTKSNEKVKSMQVLVTTLGERGSMVERKEGLKTVEKYVVKPAQVTKVVDPTGAGDAYRAGLVTGYLQKKDLQTCGQMGSIAAVYAVEKYGTMEHYYTKREFVSRYQRNFGSLKDKL